MSDPYRWPGGAGGRTRRDTRPINDPATATGLRGVHRDTRGNAIGGYTAEGVALGTKRQANGLRGLAPALARELEAAGGPPVPQQTEDPAPPASPPSVPAPASGPAVTALGQKSPLDGAPAKGPVWRQEAALQAKSVRPWVNPEAFAKTLDIAAEEKKKQRQQQETPAKPKLPSQRNALGGGLAAWEELNPNAMPAAERLAKENPPRRKTTAAKQPPPGWQQRAKAAVDARASKALLTQMGPLHDLAKRP